MDKNADNKIGKIKKKLTITWYVCPGFFSSFSVRSPLDI